MAVNDGVRGLLIVGDDLSGTAETAGAFATTSGTVVPLSLGLPPDTPAAAVSAIDAGTRAMSAALAARMMREAVGTSRDDVIVYRKVDSLLRGNIASEVAALRDVGLPMLAVLAVPRIGRTVVDGVVHRDGAPVAGGSIPQAIGAATAVFSTDDLRAGRLIPALEKCLADSVIPVLDAESVADLDLIAIAIHQLSVRPVLLAAGGLARSLASTVDVEPREGRFEPAAARTVVIVGTRTEVARRQVAELRAHGIRSQVLRPGRHDGIGDGDVVVTLDSDALWDAASISASLHALGTDIAACEERVDLVLTGGDTARRVLDAAGVVELDVEFEIEDGAVLSTRADGSAVVTRPGGFGDDAGLWRIVHRLKGESR